MSQFVQAQQRYAHLQTVYWEKYKELEQADKNRKQACNDMQEVCIHDWIRDFTDRDERSRSKCRHCNKWR